MNAQEVQLTLDFRQDVAQLRDLAELSQLPFAQDANVQAAIRLAAAQLVRLIGERAEKQKEIIMSAKVPGALSNVLRDQPIPAGAGMTGGPGK